MSYTKYKIPFPFVDIFFIVWQPNATSKIHNHSENGCHMFIIEGLLITAELTFDITMGDIAFALAHDIQMHPDQGGLPC